MAFLDSVPEILGGILTEIFVLSIFAGVVYRFFAGKFLIPKRENVLPNQRGIVVQGEKIIRVVEPGSCWIRPKQKIILCDMRLRPLQMAGVEVITGNSGIVRLSLSGKHRIANAAAYYKGSANANDAIYVEIRKALAMVAGQQSSSDIVAAPDVFAMRLREVVAPEAAKLGLEIVELDVWEARFIGRYIVNEEPANDLGHLSGGLVH